MSGFPDDFNVYGSGLFPTSAELRAEESAWVRTREILEHNKRIAAAIAKCVAELRSIGEPDRFLMDGFEFSDVIATLEKDFVFDIDNSVVGRVHEVCLDGELSVLGRGL